MTINDKQIERWEHLYKQYQSDTSLTKYDTALADHHRAIDMKRPDVQQNMKRLLDSYISNNIDTETLRQTFSQTAYSKDNVFGLKGQSGAKFFNVLVQYLSDEPAFASNLKIALHLPKDDMDGQQRMKTFFQYLESMISSHQATKKQLQPGRTPTFVSIWWHMQDIENWPVFYDRTRKALKLEGLYEPTGQPVEDYFSFRESFLSLARKLEWNSWQLEHVCDWMARSKESA